MHEPWSTIIADACREGLQLVTDSYKHRKRMKIQSEHQEELAQIETDRLEREQRIMENSNVSPSRRQEAEEYVEAAEETADGAIEDVREAHEDVSLDELKRGEDCEICLAILDELEKKPISEKVQGVKEYGQLKQFVETAPSPEELESWIDSTEVLGTIVDENLTIA